MKIFKHTIRILIVVLTVFYLLPVAVMQIPYIQKKISEKLTGYLEEKLKTEVRIETFELKSFNKLILKNVFMKDQSGDTLFTAKRIEAGFELIPLFKKKFRFKSAQLFTFNLYLSKENQDSPLNIQYIIDAFQSDEKNEKTPIDIKIRKLNLRLGNLSYRVKTATPTPGLFNPHDMAFYNISAKINLPQLTKDKLNIYLNKLSFTEKSGLHLKRLSFNCNADTSKAQIGKLNLELPSTKLQIANIQVDYGSEKEFNRMPFHLSIEPSVIYPQDLSRIVPALSDYKAEVICQGNLSGTLNDFTFNDFLLSDNNDLSIQVNGRIQNAAGNKPDQIYIETNVSNSTFNISVIQWIANSLNKKEQLLPRQIQNLGTIFFNGKVSGYANELNASGNFNTNIGALNANITIEKKQQVSIKGKISTLSLDLKQLTTNDDLGQTAFEIDVNMLINASNQVSGNIKANIQSFEYKKYKYENINISGDFTQIGFNGWLNIDEANGKLAAKGSFLLNGDNSEFNFSVDASDICLDKLHLVEKYPNPQLSFIMDANFTGDRIGSFLGNINFRQLFFSTDRGQYNMDNFMIQANVQDSIKEIRISSDLFSGEIKGIYSFKSFIPEIKQTLSIYLPSLFQKTDQSGKQEENNFAFHFTFNNNEILASILEFPITFYNQTHISGSFDNLNNKLNIEADISQFQASGVIVESGILELNNQENSALLKLKGTILQETNKINLNASFTVENNFIYSRILWNNTASQKYMGKLEFTTGFSNYTNPKEPLTAHIDLKQSQVIINDSIWTIYPASITASNDGKIGIDGFKIQHNNQFIEIMGNISHEANEQVMMKLNEVDLSYIFQTLGIKALDFGGIATGKVFTKDVYNTRQLSASLDVTDFAFNDVVFGHLLLDSSWDDEKQGIKMKGNVIKNDTTEINIDGMIYPVKEEISILFDSKNTDAAFLRKYLNKVAQNFSGQITGPLLLFGDLNHPTIEGKVYVKNGGFHIGFLNAYYTFSDTVVCTPDKIFVRNLSFYDENKNKAIANGYVKHRLFDDFQFSLHLNFDNFMAFNATKTTNPAFYGTVFGSGKVSLNGTEDLININVSVQNTKNSKMALNFMQEINVAEYNFIRFVNKEKNAIPVATQAPLPIISNQPVFINNDSKTEIRLTLSLGITPDATIDFIINPLTGDKISAYGAGYLEIQYGTSTPLKVIGNYKIEKGKYNFSLQQMLIRNFDIKEGSSITFKGDPYSAELDLNAAYTISANLGDLDERLFLLSARNNVPIDCILILKGPINQPDISFDLDLPTSTAELTRQVKSYIHTKDMMNRQILYLLVLGRFYNSPEYARSDSRINNDLSFLTSTLSSQLSNILGNLSDKLQIRTSFHQAYEGKEANTEVEILLSSTLLNNRLTINGNFGYINRNFGYNWVDLNDEQNYNAPLVGDFDVEYKLTSTGNIRLKGFNHYNYRNYYSITPELTQGIGILFRKDFNHFRDLFGRKNEETEVEEE
jgi:hypothetical protein